MRDVWVARGAAPPGDPDGDKGRTVQTVPGNEIKGGEKQCLKTLPRLRLWFCWPWGSAALGSSRGLCCRGSMPGRTGSLTGRGTQLRMRL